ncbi:autophagocytosis associated protein [Endogone sp. FLAS-F59071]|nr:autophagocytosis associated protein [Endogone sp. FLAS-F59071]|eukprot:RUS17765.1 autophagocytosis associated protein [Endogone sp. FLAS-F59071]
MPHPDTPLQHYPHLTRDEFQRAASAFLSQASNGAPEDGWIWVVPSQKTPGMHAYLASKRTMVTPTTSVAEHANRDAPDRDAPDTQPVKVDNKEEFDVIEEAADASELPFQFCILSPTIFFTEPQGPQGPQGPPTIPIALKPLSHHPDPLKSHPTTLTVDYHIVYSPSYQVPVLYFNAFYPDGTSLPLADLYTCLVPPTHLSSLSSATAASRQGSISQQDHPVLGVPYFYVHPCETAALMSAVRPGEGGCVGEEGYLRAWLSLVGGAVGVRVKVGYFVEE